MENVHHTLSTAVAAGIVLISIAFFATPETLHAQTLGDPLLDAGDPLVNTGVPRENLGYPTRNILAPGVGQVVALSHGFHTPDFSYSYMHPLNQYMHPLYPRGPYGTMTGSSVLDSNTLPASHPRVVKPVYTQGPMSVGRPTDPVVNLKMHANPWHGASMNAILWPHLGFYGHYAEKDNHKGMYVAGVALNSIGHAIGLHPGDVITKINNQPIDSPKTYMKLVRASRGPTPVEVWNIKTEKTEVLKLDFDAEDKVKPLSK